MEKYELKNDIRVVCIAASSFPDGIQEAFDALKKRTRDSDGTLYGISQPDRNGVVQYKAAKEVKEGEAGQDGMETLIIPKGIYLTETIMGWKKRTGEIPDVFQTLLSNENIDKKSFCVEWYKSEEQLVCMVRTNS